MAVGVNNLKSKVGRKADMHLTCVANCFWQGKPVTMGWGGCGGLKPLVHQACADLGPIARARREVLGLSQAQLLG